MFSDREFFSCSNLYTLYISQIWPSLEYCSHLYRESTPHTKPAIQIIPLRLISDLLLSAELTSTGMQLKIYVCSIDISIVFVWTNLLSLLDYSQLRSGKQECIFFFVVIFVISTPSNKFLQPAVPKCFSFVNLSQIHQALHVYQIQPSLFTTFQTTYGCKQILPNLIFQPH